MKFGDTVDLEAIKDLEKRGLVTISQHDRYPLQLVNYTQNAINGWMWNAIPLLVWCRGLVLEGDTVVARGFEKFFDHKATDIMTNATILEKLDGSMILGFNYKGENILTTRGSFSSPQAQLAKNIWSDRCNLNEGVSFIFELIGPSNRHVVDYPINQLVAIGAYLPDGTDVDHATVATFSQEVYGIPAVKQYPFDTYKNLVAQNKENMEGYVCVVRTKNRVIRTKIKFELYRLAHKIVFSNYFDAVYEAWTKDIHDAVIASLPAYYANLAEEYVKKLQTRQDEVLRAAFNLLGEFTVHPDRETRAAIAKHVFQVTTDKEVHMAAFALLNDKPYTIKQV